MSELAAAALEAMRARGIGNGGELLAFAEPEAILVTCRWWDRQTGVGPGLLASKIRAGGIPDEEKTDPLSVADLRQRDQRKRFEVHASRLTEGSSIETHAQLAQRVRAASAHEETDHECAGRMLVSYVGYPTIYGACDECGDEESYTPRLLDTLPAKPALRSVA